MPIMAMPLWLPGACTSMQDAYFSVIVSLLLAHTVGRE